MCADGIYPGFRPRSPTWILRRRRTHRDQFMETILERFPVVELGLPAARAYARLWAELLSIGQAGGTHDLLVAATALAMDYGVRTADIQDSGSSCWMSWRITRLLHPQRHPNLPPPPGLDSFPWLCSPLTPLERIPPFLDET